MADPVVVSPGEYATVIESDDVREFFAEIGGDIREVFLDTRQAGSRGERATIDDRGNLAAGSGTEVVLYNPRSSAGDVELSLSETGRRARLGTDGFYFDRQQRNTIDVFRQSATSVVEVNADQTSSVGSGTSQTTVVNAGPGEVWTLSKIELITQTTPGSGYHYFIVETEQTGAEVGYGEEGSGSAFSYKSGEWVNTTTSRDDMQGTKIDETNGLTVTYENDTGATQSSERDIRFQFEVTQVA